MVEALLFDLPKQNCFSNFYKFVFIFQFIVVENVFAKVKCGQNFIEASTTSKSDGINLNQKNLKSEEFFIQQKLRFLWKASNKLTSFINIFSSINK